MEALEDLARTAQAVCGVPTVLVTLADGRAGRWGEDLGEGAWLREIAARVRAGERVLTISDLLGDRQFGALRRQAGPGGGRALLGAPLIWEDEALGCLLALDTRPRLWSPEAGAGLARLARMAARLVGLEAARAALLAELDSAREAADDLEAEARSWARSAVLSQPGPASRTPLNEVVEVIDTLASPRRPISPAAWAAQAPPPALAETLRILVAEDHPASRQVLQLILQPFGFDLTFAENGQEALDALLARPGGYDLVLMDMQMPVMDGLTATRRIRAAERGVGLGRLPIAMLTANADEACRRAAAGAGADAHIAKPITVDSLLGGISRALEASDLRLAWAS